LDDLKLDKYERKIYDFILKNEGCNQNDIRNCGICAPKWAIKKLHGLVKRELIEDLRQAKSFHKYRVSNRKHYSLITKELEIIEIQRVSMERPLSNIYELQKSGGVDRLVAAPYMQKLVIPYYQSMFAMLHRLLQISIIDVGKEDSLDLRIKIISLIFEVVNQPFYNSNYKNILTQNKKLLNKFRNEVSVPGTDKSVISIHILDNFIKEIDEFEEKYG